MSSWIGPLNALRVLIRDYLDWEKGKGLWVEDLGIKPPKNAVTQEMLDKFDREHKNPWEKKIEDAVSALVVLYLIFGAALLAYILWFIHKSWGHG